MPACYHDLASVLITVGKAQAVEEFTTMEELQDAMGRVLSSEWQLRADVAISAAVKRISGVTYVTPPDLAAVKAILFGQFADWPGPDVTSLVVDSVRQFYVLAQTAVLKKWMGKKGYNVALVFKAEEDVVIQPNFNVVDQQAVEYLQNSQVFWVKDKYDKQTRDAIDASALEELEGLHGKDAGKILKDKMERAHGTGAFAALSDAYWAGVAVNAATTSRVMGIINELQEVGATKYVLSNPMDDRTTPICAYLNGMEFPVEPQVKRVQEIVEADDPQAIKTLHPWRANDWDAVFAQLGIDVSRPPSETPDAATVLSQAGFGMPPYHFNCRTTVDIA